jgi:hypothetical protein
MGDDSHQFVAIHHRQGANSVLKHLTGRFDERGVHRDCFGIFCHHVAHKRIGQHVAYPRRINADYVGGHHPAKIFQGDNANSHSSIDHRQTADLVIDHQPICLGQVGAA